MFHESSPNVPAQSNKVIPTQPLTRQNLSDQISAEQKVVSFTNELFGKLHVFILEGEEWFIANEVCKHIGHGTTATAVKDHCRKSRKLEGREFLRILNNNSNQLEGRHDLKSLRQKYGNGVILINFSDLTRLLSSSQLEAAEPFKDWVHDIVIPTIREKGNYTMVTHPAAQPTALTSDTSLILKEMSTMVMGILQSVTDANLKMQEKIQENMNITLARIENSNQNLQSAFSQTVLGVTNQIKTTIKENAPGAKWAYQGRGPLTTTQVARILQVTPPRLNTLMEREGLITLNDTNHFWLMTNKGYDFAHNQAHPDRPKKYVSEMKWDMSLVEYLRRNVAEFKRA